MKKLFLLFFPFFVAGSLSAQNNRLSNYNNVNWVQLFVNKSLGKKSTLLMEYQWRRVDGFRSWQQGLFRTAFQYQFNPAVSVAAGYAEAETHRYGQYPIAPNGTFPEHRLFQQLVLTQPLQKFTITHRFRIEQRWLGAVKAGTDRKIENWIYLNRFRYLLKAQFNYTKNWYGWVGDEIFIGAGKNVGVNVFDQNRIHAVAGYKHSKNFSIEAGYLNQTLQQGRLVNNKAIVQRNNGFTIASIIRF